MARRSQCAPLAPNSVQSKLTPDWSSFSNTKPVGVLRTRMRACLLPSAIECDAACRYAPCIGSITLSIA
jgi:hypothetical protein